MSWLSWHCSVCGRAEPTDSAALAVRLQSAGSLKRASREERKDLQYLLALASSLSDRLSCTACGAAGVTVSLDEKPVDEFDPQTPCAACGLPIPAERLELFPATTLCTACQSTVDRGGAPATQEYCPRCGTPMQIRSARSYGVSRYALVCPHCGR